MSRYLIFITLCVFLITSSFICVDSSNPRRHLKRSRREADDLVQNASVSRTRTDSDLTLTSNETITPLTAANGVSLSPVPATTKTAPRSNVSSSKIKNEANLNEPLAETAHDVDLDSFIFNEETFCGAEAPQDSKKSIFDGPFRADYYGKTILLNHETSLVSMKEYNNYLLRLCELNELFKSAAAFKSEHYFIKDELNMDIDAEAYDLPSSAPQYVNLSSSSSLELGINADTQVNPNTNSSAGSVNIPPLHPLFRLVREIVVYSVGKGKLEVLKEAKSAGMNLNFDILLNCFGLKLSLLHFACIMKSPYSCEVIKFLIKEAGIDPNQVDSRGYSPMHHVAYHDNALFSELLISLGADPNLLSKRADFIAPIHIAAKMKSYNVLRSLINLNFVNMNVLNFEGHHLIHYAIKNRSFSLFSTLSEDPRIILDFAVVQTALNMISSCLTPEDAQRYNEVLLGHLMNRPNAHESHSQFISFHLIATENLPALRVLHSKGFNFNFLHTSQCGRPQSSPLLVAVFYDKLESFKFLASIGISLTEDLGFPNLVHIIILAICRSSLLIIKHLLDTLTMISDVLMGECLKTILRGDFASVLKLFLDKFGNEMIWAKVAEMEPEIDPETNPNIFTLQVTSL